jgi:dipeptidyl-peptidase-4
MFRSYRRLWILTPLWLACHASAQEAPKLTLATVLQRGPALAAPSPQVLWLPGGHDATVILDHGDQGQALHRIVDGKVVDTPAATAAAVRAVLPTDASKAPARFPPVSWLDPDTLRIVYDRSVWHWDLGSSEATRQLSWNAPAKDSSAFGEPMLQLAPGDGHAAVRRDHQLWLHDRQGELHQLTFDGSEDVVYGGAAHRAEFGITQGMFWSADGRYLAFYREDLRPIAPYPYQNATAMPPAPRRGRYPMAGRAHSRVQVLVCDTTDYRVTPMASDPDADVYWTNLTFTQDGKLLVSQVNRGQDHVELVRFDPRSGARLGTLLREHDREWIEPEHPAVSLPGGRFLWWSNRSGYRHLFLHEADGKLVRQVTNGNFDVQALLHVAANGNRVWFTAAGEDPRQLHLFSAEVTVDGQRRLTRERGTHQVELSPDAQRASVVWSNLEQMPRARLLELQSGETTALPQPENPLEKFRLPGQRFFEVEAEDGTVLYGHLALPADFDPKQRYPVLHYVYGGPHAQLVKDQWFGGAAGWLQALTADGFVVCRLDNRGTPNRGIEFEQKIHRHLGTVEVEDQMRAIAWLKQQPFVDGGRIGVHGWSFGGYMTLRLMLLHPEAFACGISGAPVTDWAMYETGYTERYMDSPAENPDGFAASSCLPLAGRLKRPLLLVHGSDDRTVMWSHTLQFVDRCIAAGTDLDYFPYPQQLHGLRGHHRAHFLRKLRTYLLHHLQPR